MRIVGTGFQSGVLAVLDGVRVAPRFNVGDAGLITMFLETPSHPAGTIDIVVTNSDGQSDRLAGEHTYVEPDAFDPNGEWIGEAQDGSHRLLDFIIQNRKLRRASCTDMDGPITELSIAEPISVAGGAFSVFGTPSDAPSGSRDAVEIMSGRIVSTTEMVGTVNFRECTNMTWRAGVTSRQVR